MNEDDQDIDLSDEVTDNANAVSALNKAVGNPLNELLGPLAKVYGAHWAAKAQARLDAKQQQNLQAKIDRADETKLLLFDNGPTPRQVGALIEWTDLAKNVDEVLEPELSAAWSAALVDISQQSYVLIDSLSKMTEEDVVAFSKGGSLKSSQLVSFFHAGLIKHQVRSEVTKKDKIKLFVYLPAIAISGLIIGTIVNISTGSSNQIVEFSFWPLLADKLFTSLAIPAFIIAYIYSFELRDEQDSLFRSLEARIVLSDSGKLLADKLGLGSGPINPLETIRPA